MRKSTLRNIALLCILMLATQSCIEEYNVVLPSEDTDLLVVEGTIISDYECTIKLSRTIPLQEERETKSTSGAAVTVIGSDGLKVSLHEQMLRGVYRGMVPKLNPDAEYHLQIVERDGETYETVPQKPLATNPIQAIEYDQPDPNGNIDILLTTAVPANPDETQYYRWTWKETWEVRAEYTSNVKWDPKEMKGIPLTHPYQSIGWMSAQSKDIIASSSAYYGNNQITRLKLYDFGRTDRRIQRLYSTEILQRSISKAEYEYENERRRISNDMGGLFTPQPSVLPSNIRCTTSKHHAIGYVGCSMGYSRQRLFISSEDVNSLYSSDCITFFSDQQEFPGDEVLYKRGFMLLTYIDDPMKGIVTGWTSFKCLDVSTIGASPEKPSFWPN